jgi:hypothetical protein
MEHDWKSTASRQSWAKKVGSDSNGYGSHATDLPHSGCGFLWRMLCRRWGVAACHPGNPLGCSCRGHRRCRQQKWISGRHRRRTLRGRRGFDGLKRLAIVVGLIWFDFSISQHISKRCVMLRQLIACLPLLLLPLSPDLHGRGTQCNCCAELLPTMHPQIYTWRTEHEMTTRARADHPADSDHKRNK